HSGSVLYSRSGGSFTGDGTTGTAEFRGKGVGAAGNRLSIGTQNVTVTAGTGGAFISDSGAQPTNFTVTVASGDIDLFSEDLGNNGITVVAPLNTPSGNISIRADDSVLIKAPIGGVGFGGTIFVEANRDGGNGQVIQIDAGSPVITTNSSTSAIQFVTHP